jgi:hypothetical protein
LLLLNGFNCVVDFTLELEQLALPAPVGTYDPSPFNLSIVRDAVAAIISFSFASTQQCLAPNVELQRVESERFPILVLRSHEFDPVDPSLGELHGHQHGSRRAT